MKTDIVKYPRSKQLSSQNQVIQLLYRLIVTLKYTGECYVFIAYQDQPPAYEDLDDNVPITVHDNDGRSQIVMNDMPRVPQGMDYVDKTIGK